MAETLQPSPPASADSLSPHKRKLFIAVLLLLPVLGLALLEGGLRLAGFGGYPPILRPVGQTEQGTLIITDIAGAASYFFANRERPGYNEQYRFYQPKSSNTVRIFLVGESAMKGFPQPRHLASSAFLAAMLQDVWPDRRVEVINLGTTAVASFPVLDIMTEALNYDPDLIIVSTGHNEFFGTFGVASRGRAGTKPWMLRATRWFHSLSIVQAVAKLIPGGPPPENKTLMELMAGENFIAPDDPRREAAAENLKANVSEMIRRGQARGVPVVVCTQPSNERDLAPIGAEKPRVANEEQARELEELLARGEATSRTNLETTIERFQTVLRQNPEHARAHFLLGRVWYASGNFAAAAKQFAKARDFDSMPWRAPGRSQEAILQAAQEHRAVVCDLQEVFRAASPGGSIGWELMDDHVHPTLRGQALMARAWVETLTRMPGRLQVGTNELTRLADWEDYAQRLGDNPLDRYGVAHTMRVIFDVPFMRQNNPEAHERFNRIASDMEESSPPEMLEVMREWQTASPHAGGKRPLTGMAARVLMRQGRFDEALDLLNIAQRAVPTYTSWHLEYVYFALACREKINGSLSQSDRAVALEAIRGGTFLLRHGFSESGLAERYVGRLHQLREEFAEAIPFLLASRRKLAGTDLVAADQALIVSYLKTDKVDEAMKLARYGAGHAGQYAPMYQNMLAEITRMTGSNAPPKP